MLTSIEEGHATWREYIEGTQEDIRQEMAENSQRETKGKDVAAQLDKVAGERGVEVASPQAAPPVETLPLSPQHSESAALQEPKPQDQPPPTPAADDQESIKHAIATAEFLLKNTDVGTKKWQAILGIMKIRLQHGQAPMDVLPKEQVKFYLAQMERAIAALKTL